MALNVAKTESMVISTRPKLARLQGQRIQITHNGTEIKSVDSHKLLGLVLDEQLTWNSHIDEICSKVLKRINLLKAIKTYLPQWSLLFNVGSSFSPNETAINGSRRC